jgi:hypothetical protein
MPAVYPPNVLPADFRGHYPHMARRDGEVWVRFLANQPAPFLGFAYDVAVGGWKLEGLQLAENDLLGWQYNTALKVDAVGLTADEAWVIEVRPEATVSALGAALTYAMVLDREQVFSLPLRPVICCEQIQPDVEWACGKLGVRVVRV